MSQRRRDTQRRIRMALHAALNKQRMGVCVGFPNNELTDMNE